MIGSTVKIYDIEFAEEVVYRLVGSTEANSIKGKISNESPVGRALIGAVVGFVAALLSLIGMQSGGLGGMAVAGVLIIAMSVLFIIGFIMNIVGINRAKIDEDEFTKALLFVILGIAASVNRSIMVFIVVRNGNYFVKDLEPEIHIVLFIRYGFNSCQGSGLAR